MPDATRKFILPEQLHVPVGVTAAILLVFVPGAIVWGYATARLDAHERDIASNKELYSIIREDQNTTDRNIAVIETKMDSMIEAIGNFGDKLDKLSLEK